MASTQSDEAQQVCDMFALCETADLSVEKTCF